MNNKMENMDTQRQADDQLAVVRASYEAPAVTDLGSFRDVTLGIIGAGTDGGGASA